MLAKRVIPSVLVRGKTAYKGPGFGAACTRSIGSAMSVCRTHAKRGVDELLLLDIGATPEGRGPDLGLVHELSAECFIPITVGGGVRSIGDIAALLHAGADKVAIGKAAWAEEGSDFVRRAADHFGSQAIVCVVEHALNLLYWNGRPLVRRGLSHPLDMAELLQEAGAGEIVLQSVETEARMEGYQRDIVAQSATRISIPVIVSGGCSGPRDMLAAIRAGADGCAAGALFQFTDCTPRECSRYLKANGIEVRL